MRGRILVVDHATPTPDQDSGSASTFAYLRILARSGFRVTFVPANLSNAGRYTEALKELGIDTPTAPEWTSLNAVVETFGPRSDALLLYRAPTAIRVFDLARRVAPAAKIVFHPVDLHFLRMQREAELTKDRAAADSAEAMRAIELGLVAQADAAIVVSAHERILLRELVPGAVVHQIPILRETPQPPRRPGWRRLFHKFAKRQLGAPAAQFSGGKQGFAARRDFLFIGGYSHTPNIDAVLWFVREVWPRIRAKGFPDRFIIVGSNVPGEIAALASDSIEVRGHVPDLASVFNGCRLSIAPLRYGAGIKGKVVSSLSYGVPVVATSIAVEGMGLQHEENVLVAEDPDEMADQILRLYTDAELWLRLSSNGYQAFQATFSEASSGAEKVLTVFDGLAGATVSPQDEGCDSEQNGVDWRRH
jgi:O-antigen biosynthesis protein